MGGGGKSPKKSAAEKALDAAQLRALSKSEDDLNEATRRTLRSQLGGRGSLLSGGARGVRPGEERSAGGTGASAPRSTLGPQVVRKKMKYKTRGAFVRAALGG